MSKSRSRYEKSRLFRGEKGGEPIFKGIRPRLLEKAEGVLEYTIQEGDRLDLLALHFYNNMHRWWRILDANPQIVFGADLLLEKNIGETILIPRSVEPGD